MVIVVNIMLIDDDLVEELIFCVQMKKVVNYDINMLYVVSIEDVVVMFGKGVSVDIVFLDNCLGFGEDFCESVLCLCQSGYIGLIGVILFLLIDFYFQFFVEYGVDFCIDKVEFDLMVIGFLIQEYVVWQVIVLWDCDWWLFVDDLVL